MRSIALARTPARIDEPGIQRRNTKCCLQMRKPTAAPPGPPPRRSHTDALPCGKNHVAIGDRRRSRPVARARGAAWRTADHV